MTALACWLTASLSIAMRMRFLTSADTFVRKYYAALCVGLFFVYLHCFDLNNSGARFFSLPPNSSCLLDWLRGREREKNQQRINKRFIVWLYELLSHSIHEQTHDTECECDCHHMFCFLLFPVLPLGFFFVAFLKYLNSFFNVFINIPLYWMWV